MANFNRFGVPIPSDGRRQMGWPKPKNKYRVLLFGFGADDSWDDDGICIAYETNTVALPKFTVATHELHHFDNITNISGKHRWQSMNLEIKDTIDNKPTKAVYRQIQKYRDFNRRIAPKVNRGKYKFEMWIQLLGSSAASEVTGIDKVAYEANRIKEQANDVNSILNDGLDIAETAIDAWDTITGAGQLGIGTVLDTLNAGINIADNIDNIQDTLTDFGAVAADIKADLFTGTMATWVCSGCLMTDVDFGELDYTTADFNTISLSILPDTCMPIDANGNPLSLVPGTAAEQVATSVANDIADDIDAAVDIFNTGRDIVDTATDIWNTASGVISNSDPTTSIGGFFGGLF